MSSFLIIIGLCLGQWLIPQQAPLEKAAYYSGLLSLFAIFLLGTLDMLAKIKEK